MAAVVVVVAAAVYVVGFTGVLGVRHVTVTGVRALSADQVRAAAGVPDGRPLARVDTGAVADHVRALPGVERVAVARSWPGTLRITITERHGVAVVKRAGAYWLVDPDGVVFQRAGRAGRSCRCSTSPTSGRTTRPRRRRWPRSPRCRRGCWPGSPPCGRRPRSRSRSTLTDGRTVFWGGGEDSAAKAAVLGALLSRPGRHYDVSTPSVVTVR